MPFLLPHWISIAWYLCLCPKGVHLEHWCFDKKCRAEHSYKTLFFNIVTSVSCAFFASSEQEPAYYAHKNVCSRLERDLSFTSLSPLLKCSALHFFVLASTVWSLQMFCKCHWMSVGAIFYAWMNLIPHLCFMLTSMSDGHCVRLPLCCHLSQGCKM